MSTFKFLTNNDFYITFGPTYLLPVWNNHNQNNEYCFQFDDEEPFVFATGNGQINITLPPNNDSVITICCPGNKLTRLPENMNFPNLQEFYCSYNNLTFLPENMNLHGSLFYGLMESHS